MASREVKMKGTAATAQMRREMAELKKQVKALAKASREATTASGKQGKGLEKLEKRMKATRDGLGRMQKVMGAAGLVGVAVLAARTVDSLSQKTIELRNVFGTATTNVDMAAKAVDNMTTKFELQRQANTLTNAELDISDKTYAEFAGTIAKLADSTGRDLVPMLNAATESIIRGNIEGIAGLGIKFDSTKLLADEAAALGKTSQELSLVEKRQIALNALLVEGARATADYEKVNLGLAGSFVRSKNEAIDFFQGILSGKETIDSIADSVKTTALGMDELAESMRVVRDEGDLLTKQQEKAAISGVSGLVGGARFRKGGIEEANKRKRAEAAKRRGRGRARDPATEGELLLAEAKFERELEMEINLTAAKKQQSDEQLEAIRVHNETAAQMQVDAAQLELETRMQAIEIQREQGVDPISLIEQEREARLEFTEFIEEDAERQAIAGTTLGEVQRIEHEAQLKRMAASAKEQARRAAEQKALFTAVTGAARQHASNIEEAANLAGKGQAAAHVVAMGIRAAVEVAESAAAFARFDFIGGAAHAVAAGLAVAAAAKAAAQAGGGGGDRSVSLPPPPSGPSGPPTGSVGPTGGGDTDTGGLPISPADVPPGSATQQGGGGDGAGGGNTIVVQGNTILATNEDELGTVLERIAADKLAVQGPTN